MLRQLFASGDIKTTIIIILLEIPVIMLSLSLHETAHGYVAYKCGDGTAKAFGRLTLNPAKHLDFVGTLFMFLFGFGWAKPVPVNTRNLRKPKRDIALVSIAGPVSNLLLALVFAAAYVAMMFFAAVNGSFADLFSQNPNATSVIFMMLYLGIVLNVGLAIFNLIPLPPLDGSNVLLSLLPQSLAVRYVKVRNYTQYIYLGIVALSWFTPELFNLLFTPFDWICSGIVNGYLTMFTKLFILFV